MRLFLRGNLKKILSRLESGEVSAIEAAAMLGSLEAQLKENGLDEQLNKLGNIYLDELESVQTELRLVTGKIVPFSNFDADSIEALINFETDAISNRVAEYVGDLKPVMMRTIIGGERVNVSELVDTEDETIIRQIKTEIDTAVMAFSRTITIAKAEELGIDKFEYFGPDDKITREFCGHVLNGTLDGFERDSPIYTSEEIDSMDNGQDLPVAEYCGGYNCRHRWLATPGET